MPPAARFAATFLVFSSTLVLAMVRLRGSNEAVWTSLGAGVMLALGLVTTGDVLGVLHAAREPLLFLLALLVLACLLERSGFFDWAAIRSAQLARGDGRALYRNVFLLGAAVTALLSLDTTAVIMTPLVLALVERLGLPARPYVFACAFVANTASLLLPISNLTNLLLAAAFHLGFTQFVARMVLPQAVALGLTFALLRAAFRAELPPTFSVERLLEARSVVPHRRYFQIAVGGLVVVAVGYFLGPLAGVPPYVPALACAFALAAVGARLGLVGVSTFTRHGGWSVFPFVVGLFVVVRGVENLGLAGLAAEALRRLPARGWTALPAVIAASAITSNVVNNLPATLVAGHVLRDLQAPPVLIYGALLGTNLGPNVITFGSLATVLVIGRARARGQRVDGLAFLRVGLAVTPLALGAAGLALALVFAVWP